MSLLVIASIITVDKLSAELNKIQLSGATSAPNTKIIKSDDSIQNNTNTPKIDNSAGTTEPVTPTKQINTGSELESDLFVLMLREARPGSPYKKYVQMLRH